MSKKYAILVIVLITVAVMIPSQRAEAQGVESDWSLPFRLSSLDLKAGPASLVSDQYGLTHILWTEGLPDGRSIIKYSRFNGDVWAVPISIYISGTDQTIKGLSPIVDEAGILHLYWTEGILIKGVKYMSAPVQNALSAQEWNSPVRLTIFAEEMRVIFAQDGTRHMLVTRVDQGNQGIYHTYSTNNGNSWSVPTWLDPNIPTGMVPSDISFKVDDRGGLHAVWGYSISDLSVEFNNWIRYAGLPPGETVWRTFTIDRVDPDDKAAGYQLNAAGPIMTVSGSEVAVIWAGGILHYRHFRHSNDYGATWSNPVRVFGELNGQAQDGFSVDSLGRIHYFAQIRFPVGIYHAVWNGERWTSPDMVYFIRYSGAGTDDGKVEAHFTLPTILKGNKLVLTFTDEPPAPKRGLYVMTSVINDAPELETVSLPENVIAPTVVPSATPPTAPETPAAPDAVTGTADSAESTPSALPDAEVTPTSIVVVPGDLPEGPQTTPNTALVIGMVISLLVVVGIVVARMFSRR